MPQFRSAQARVRHMLVRLFGPWASFILQLLRDHIARWLPIYFKHMLFPAPIAAIQKADEKNRGRQTMEMQESISLFPNPRNTLKSENPIAYVEALEALATIAGKELQYASKRILQLRPDESPAEDELEHLSVDANAHLAVVRRNLEKLTSIAKDLHKCCKTWRTIVNEPPNKLLISSVDKGIAGVAERKATVLAIRIHALVAPWQGELLPVLSAMALPREQRLVLLHCLARPHAKMTQRIAPVAPQDDGFISVIGTALLLSQEARLVLTNCLTIQRFERAFYGQNPGDKANQLANAQKAWAQLPEEWKNRPVLVGLAKKIKRLGIGKRYHTEPSSIASRSSVSFAQSRWSKLRVQTIHTPELDESKHPLSPEENPENTPGP